MDVEAGPALVADARIGNRDELQRTLGCDLRRSVRFGVIIEQQDTAAAIWHAIIDKGTRDRVVDSLLDEYDIERSALSEHVDQFIQQLEEIGLLEVATT